jgi:hypothetical protein
MGQACACTQPKLYKAKHVFVSWENQNTRLYSHWY